MAYLSNSVLCNVWKKRAIPTLSTLFIRRRGCMTGNKKEKLTHERLCSQRNQGGCQCLGLGSQDLYCQVWSKVVNWSTMTSSRRENTSILVMSTPRKPDPLSKELVLLCSWYHLLSVQQFKGKGTSQFSIRIDIHFWTFWQVITMTTFIILERKSVHFKLQYDWLVSTESTSETLILTGTTKSFGEWMDSPHLKLK